MPDRISNTLIYVYDYKTVLKRFQQLFEDFYQYLYLFQINVQIALFSLK